MVLAEIPLWVSHGNPPSSSSDGARTLVGMGFAAAASCSPTDTNNNNDTTMANDPTPPHPPPSRPEIIAAKDALSLLSSSSSRHGGGSGAAPMYSIDIHPDGTRFATAGGDGSVKIWSMSSLFGGKLVLLHDDETNGESTDIGGDNGGGRMKTKKKNENRKRKIMPTSKFTGNGNYISSNTEDYDDDATTSSSSSSSEGEKDASRKTKSSSSSSTGRISSLQQQQQQPAQHQSETSVGTSSSTSRMAPPIVMGSGVNDLSGLVRRKKGGGNVATAAAAATNPFTAMDRNANSISGDVEPLSPLSRLTQHGSGGGNSLAASATTTGGGASISTSTNIDCNNSKTGRQKQQPNKLLCTISSSHTGSVLSVRFSPSGIYLATAGDDSYVNIYTRCLYPSLAKMGNLVGVGGVRGHQGGGGGGGLSNALGVGIGGGGGGSSSSSSTGMSEDIEHWNRIAVCRGHHLDVVGLAWAPDDSHLVSCSLDSVNPIIVWRLYDVLNGGDGDGGGSNNNVGGDAGAGLWNSPTRAAAGGGRLGGMGGTFSSSSTLQSNIITVHNLHPHKILGRNVHTSTVKGVAFDPAGKYLASSGDDPAICIWRAFDDWGLEARIDSSSGVFRSKKRKRQVDNIRSPTTINNNNNSHSSGYELEEDDPGELASLSLFRRISFAPDGSHVCGTNATLRGKNIAAMISREGWMASGPRGSSGGNGGEGGDDARPPSGAANLVGHKQPVVASRHCPVFFTAPERLNRRGGSTSSSESEMSDEVDDPEEEPEYATLVALGDKRGFVTVWSTKSTRPLFKMQCSESRCTVTDISWGVVRQRHSEKNVVANYGERDGLVMIVSLLDGYVVALNFDVPEEVGGGTFLTSDKTRQIFRAKYGIEDFVGSYCFTPGNQHQPRKRLVDDAAPILVQNAFQVLMEMEAGAEINDFGGSVGHVDKEEGGRVGHPLDQVAPAADRSVSDDDNDVGERAVGDGKKQHEKNKVNTAPALQSALHAASVAAVAAEGVATLAANRVVVGGNANSVHQTSTTVQSNARLPSVPESVPNVDKNSASTLESSMRVPFIVSKILSVDLTSKLATSMTSTASTTLSNSGNKIIVDCTNVTTDRTTLSSWPYATLTISSGGVKKWKDIFVRTNATALAANHQLLVVGTSDGCLYFYGTSPTVGWMSGKAYRAFPPFVLGSPVAHISIRGNSLRQSTASEMVVVSSDGNFFVYSVDSVKPTLAYKGSIVPAMQHMQLLSASVKQQCVLSSQPKLARIQITDSNQLMLILILPLKSFGGRSIEGFIYNRDMELWMCISDSSAFVVSDFYSTLPSDNVPGLSVGSDQRRDEGMLAKMDRIVRSSSSVIASAKQLYQKITFSESGSTTDRTVTRSHCEDRLVCSIALGSPHEFKTWLRYYARCLVSSGDEIELRFLVDILLCDMGAPSFLSEGTKSLNLVGKDLVRGAILPELHSSRSLQRFTNELSMELESLG